MALLAVSVSANTKALEEDLSFSAHTSSNEPYVTIQQQRLVVCWEASDVMFTEMF